MSLFSENFLCIREKRTANREESVPSQESEESGVRLAGADCKDCQS